MELHPLTIALFTIITKEAEDRGIQLDMSDLATFCALYQEHGLAVAIENAETFCDSLITEAGELKAKYDDDPTTDKLREVLIVMRITLSMKFIIAIAQQFIPQN